MSKLSPEIIFSARSKANPYEGVYKSPFAHSDAVKLANLNALCGILPKDHSQSVSFLTVGASPGFAEYILSRYTNAKGYGINVKSDNIELKNFANLTQSLDFYNWKDLSVLFKDLKGVGFVSGFTDV